MTQTQRYNGEVKWFNSTKGWGFITPSERVPGVAGDVFLHVTGIEAPVDRIKIQEMNPKKDRIMVTFTLGNGKDSRPVASCVRVV